MIEAVIQLADDREVTAQVNAPEPPPVLRIATGQPAPGESEPPSREYVFVRQLPSGRFLYKQARTESGLYTGAELGL